MAAPKKKTSNVTAERVQQMMFSRFNPIRGLTPTKLSVYLDQFDAGYLSAMAQLMHKIEERDDTCVCVVPKRKKSVARHGFEIVTFDDSPEALAQKEALEYFFGGLTATSAVDEDIGGDINLLMEQMMDAEGKRWAAHEIVWQPSPEGLTATFRFVPLWFFEHTTSRLRYLPREGMLVGEELKPGEWMVTRGTGLMVACSILYVFKHIPLQDLLNYCERYAVPGLHGKTDAPKGSDEWNALRDALSFFGKDWKLITNSAADITPIDAAAKGDLPHPKLIERMDRAITAIWRGGDLSTMSAKDSVGASVQAEEKEILEDADIELIEGTLNRQTVPYVIWYTRGTRDIKAALRIIRPNRADAKQELETDTFLLKAGCPLSIIDLLERYGRTLPDDKEELAVWREGGAPADPTPQPLVNSNPVLAMLNAVDNTQASVQVIGDRKAEALKKVAIKSLANAMQDDFRPLAQRLQAALAQEDDAKMMEMLRTLRSDMPALLANVNSDPAAAKILEESITAALINGLVEGAVSRQGESP